MAEYRKKINGNDTVGRHLQVRQGLFKMMDKVKIYKSPTTIYFPWLEKESVYILRIMFRSNLTIWVMNALCHNSCWLDRGPICQDRMTIQWEMFSQESRVCDCIEDMVNYFLVITVVIFLWFNISVILVNMELYRYFYSSDYFSVTRNYPQILFPHTGFAA